MSALGNAINKIIDYRLLLRVVGLVRPFRGYFRGAIVLAIVMAALAVINPYLVHYTIDHYIMIPNLHMVGVMAAVLMASLFVQASLSYSFTFLTGWLGQSIIAQLRLKVFSHLVFNNTKFFDKTPIGTATTRTINDIETINDIFSEGIITIISDLLTIIAIITFMLILSWKLTLAALIVLPILLTAAYYFKEGVRKTFNDVRTQVARLNAFLQEHITGMSVVQIFNAENREHKKFDEINAAHRDANIKSIFYYSVFFPVVEVISSLAMGSLVWFWAHGRLEGEFKYGQLVAFIFCVNLLFRPIRMLADKFNTLQMGMIAAERIFKLTDDQSHQVQNGAVPANHIKGEIEFKNVSFAYEEGHDVLKNISFKLNAGEMLAIVGATGSGKSTIINLLGRYYDINSGEILLDGVDIRKYDVYSLRRNTGVVLQDVFLFSGSVYDNIALKNNEFNLEEVIATAKLFGIHDFIERLPGGYNFNVMERGSTLSLGQRQLISFVRALLLNPRVLVLDEATSSIDTETERIIQQAISKVVEGRTSIVIAHRLSTIQKANKIMVMSKGEIVEFGSHEELLRNNGYYAKLYKMQFSLI